MSHSSDSVNFTDLSGLSQTTTDDQNPYNALISACNNDASQISNIYTSHRLARNAQQRDLLLSPNFTSFSTDPILSRLLAHHSHHPEFTDYKDPRHCLVFWARPSQQVRELISSIQTRLKAQLPSLWLMPPENLHITVLELAHSRTADEISALLSTIQAAVHTIVNHTSELADPPVLVKPMIGFDKAALALSFVPAPSPFASDSEEGAGAGNAQDEAKGTYTYHHLRRDVFDLCKATGVDVGSRYVVPSAHLTIGRWVDPPPALSTNHTARDHTSKHAAETDRETATGLVNFVESVNEELRSLYWGEGGKDVSDEEGKEGLRWIVGEEKGLVLRRGTVWYGGGESVAEGQGRVNAGQS